MIGLDTLELSSTKVSHICNNKLLDILKYMADKMNLSLAGVNVSKVGMSNADSFAKRKIPILSIDSVTQETWGILHS